MDKTLFMNKQTIGKAESIESKYRVNHVDSRLPRWLIEVAFACLLLQGVCTWTLLMHWMEAHLPLALAVIQTFGAVVMYYGLLRGMKPLYRPCTIWWRLVIALNLAGFITTRSQGQVIDLFHESKTCFHDRPLPIDKDTIKNEKFMLFFISFAYLCRRKPYIQA